MGRLPASITAGKALSMTQAAGGPSGRRGAGPGESTSCLLAAQGFFVARGFFAAHGFCLADFFFSALSAFFSIFGVFSDFFSAAHGFFAAHGLVFGWATAPVRLARMSAETTAATVRTRLIIPTHPPSLEVARDRNRCLSQPQYRIPSRQTSPLKDLNTNRRPDPLTPR